MAQGGTEDLDDSAISGAILGQVAGKLKDIVTDDGEEATNRLTEQGEKPKIEG